MIVEGANKRLWIEQQKLITRKIAYHLVGQNQFFSLTMKNGIIIFILIVSSPVILPFPTSIFHMTFSLSLCVCYFYLYKIYVLISRVAFENFISFHSSNIYCMLIFLLSMLASSIGSFFALIIT